LKAPTARLAPWLRWQRVRRLLVVRLDNLGDVLMCTPALAALRSGLPQAHITLLTSPGGALAAPHLPMVDAVWPCATPWVRAGLDAATAGPTGQAERTLMLQLASGRFDAAVIFTSCTQSPLPAALLCRLAGIPLALAHCRENAYALLSDAVPETDVVAAGMRHEVLRQCALVAHVLKPVQRPASEAVDEAGATSAPRLQFALRPGDRSSADALLTAAAQAAGQAVGQRPIVLLHPGASASSRRWPAGRFGQAAAAVAAARPDCLFVFAGGPGDEAAVQQAGAQATSASPSSPGVQALALPCTLALGQLAALVERAAVLVANNSAPGHLAAALGTPVVSLYALTNPQHTPWGVAARVLSHDVPCRWCLKSTCPENHHACLMDVTPAQVAQAVLQLLP